MFRFCFPVLACLIFSCSTDALNEEVTLDNALAGKRIVLNNVIACAASNENNDVISVFFYPRPGTANFQYFETEDSTFDKNDFDNYIPVVVPIHDVFNGYLKKFEVSVTQEKWVIVSFDEGGETHLSNPIRLKQKTKPTEYASQNVSVGMSTSMPEFSWRDGLYKDSIIYFQVVSDSQNNLLTGTYTHEKRFQYSNLDNVVLNITKGTPPTLKENASYSFTLMAVSEDNWVNLFAEKEFEIEKASIN